MLQKVFSDIYKNNYWATPETKSGIGSTLEWTYDLRKELPILFEKLEIKSILDAGCGDYNWMRKINLKDYKVLACDIVPEMVQNNTINYSNLAYFFYADITKDGLPQVDLILCRTVLFHLSFYNVKLALENFEKSNTKYLLMTNHPHITINENKIDGDFRRLNFCLSPFNFPPPVISIHDGAGDDGYLCLWKRNEEL